MASVEQIQSSETTADEVVNTVVDEGARLGVRRFFTIPGRDPFDEIEWETRDALIPGRDGPAFEQRGVEFPKFWSQTATNIVAQKYFRGRLSSPERESSVKQMIGRVVDTVVAWGKRGRLLRRRRGGRDVRGRAEGDPRQPVRLVQQPGLVQRRLRGDAAVLGLLHPLDRRLDGRDPRLDPPRGRHLPRRLRLGRQPLAAALVEGAALEGRLRLRSGLLHARRRRVRRHDQVGRQDAARGEDGRPRRRPSRHRGVHLVQGQGGAQGARPRGRPATTCRSTRPTGRRSSTRTRTTPSASATRSWRPPTRARSSTSPPAPTAPSLETVDARDLLRQIARGGVGVRRSGRAVRHDDQRVAHAARTRAASTRRTRARSTCRSTTRRATSRRST